jgi:pyruvate dehydrogenase E1 component beta subunit
MTMITFRQAIRDALREEMRQDPRVFILGVDIGGYGGVFKVTEGLLAEFGPDRVIDTPISESAIVGAAVGAALVGRRPVAEVMYADFATIAMDHIANSAAKMSYMYGGELTVPVVIRMAYGAGRRSGAHHSQSPEAMFANFPGLTIVMPSTPHDAKGLLKSAIRYPSPVIFMEHKLLYNKAGEVPGEEYLVPLGKADVKRVGSDVTIAATGVMVDRALLAAQQLKEETGLEAEVIDLRTVLPLDVDSIVSSVRKTGRLVVVHEAPVSFGIGAEVAAVVANQAFGYLDAPIQRVGAPFTPIPVSPPLEDAYIVSKERILDAVRTVVG